MSIRTVYIYLVLWKHNNGELTWQWSGRRLLTPPTKRVSHRGSLLKGGSAVSKHVKCNVDLKKENVHKQQLENTFKQSRFKHLRELHEEWTEAMHQESTRSDIVRKRATHIPDIERSILPAQWSKVLFRWMYISLFICKSRSQSLERNRIHVACSPVWSFHSHVICWCRSTVNTDIYQHFMRPSADQRYGDAEFIFQQAPAHTAKGTKAGSMTMCYCVWLASTLAWPEARWETPDPTMQDCYQSHLCFITPEQCHRLIVSMPRRTDAVVHPTNHRLHWNKRGYILFLLILCNCIIFRDIEFSVFIICRPQSSKFQEIKAWNISLCVQWIYLIYGFHFLKWVMKKIDLFLDILMFCRCSRTAPVLSQACVCVMQDWSKGCVVEWVYVGS